MIIEFGPFRLDSAAEILFRGAEPIMRKIARQSGGTYTHVDAPPK